MTFELRLTMPPRKKKRCRNPECKTLFSAHFAQLYCTPDCKKIDYRRKRDENRADDLP